MNIIERIKKLDIPEKAKAELLLLWQRAKTLVENMLAFIERHKHLGEAIVVGALVAWLLSHTPMIGGLLALCALVTSAAIGVLRELRAEVELLFHAV